MNVTQLIAKKRDGGELSDGEIADLVAGYVDGRVTDYQMSAFAMAVYLRGMTTEETASLTMHKLHSGITLCWDRGRPKVDKHSTGGIGDKTSLILAPLLACCGVQVPMISGRGLGPTGGTLDKLESIPGFRTDLSIDDLEQQTEQIGCVITGASAELVPADRRLYALRDVTATVSCLPLITASIMSKKLAEGLDALVLDVKWGSGAFMKTLDDARALARSMVDVGNRLGVKTTALITDMNQPLGRMAGNAVEVDESLDVLQGEGPEDLRTLTIALAAEVLVSAGLCQSSTDAGSQVTEELDGGRAMQKFEEMIAAQGGDLSATRRIAGAVDVAAPQSGVVQAIDTEVLGYAVIEMGGGRKQQGDAIDNSVGLEMLVRIGDEVEAMQPLVRVFAQPLSFDRVCPMIRSAITIGEELVTPPQLIIEQMA